MRLKSLKLVGFKSFVDPTTIPFPTNLAAIVGPNGCGKSNIVDAIRWVMGESSAKHLRGEAMTDVIFNGSSARKPVGQASVELLFDNSDGGVKGEYAKYTEIALKRQVNRDGQSTYFLNGTKCRRKDITDVFLGTGLGTRNSYSIIEQGMISRFIEAKPDDLRAFIEEAAGISKYKERRRETKNRIRHTRENLERLDDLREEIAKQLEHLHRQARTAEKYKVLKQDERLVKAQLLGLHWQDMDYQIKSHDAVIKEQEVNVEQKIAEQRHIDAEIEKYRQDKIELGDTFNDVQARYYSVGSEISRLEQSIGHHRERFQQLQADQEQVEKSWQDLTTHIDADATNLEQWGTDLAEVEPSLVAAKASVDSSSDVLDTAEHTMSEWQAQWDSFNQQASVISQKVSVEQTRMQHLQQQIERNQVRLTRMQAEHEEINPHAFDIKIAKLQQQQSQAQQTAQQRKTEAQAIRGELQQQREKYQTNSHKLNEARSELQTMLGRQSSLHALQQASLGEGEGSASSWLAEHQLDDKARLAQKLQVSNGWETAVETVLGAYLEAVCVEDIAEFSDFKKLSQGEVLLFDKTHQADNVSTGLADMLADQINSDYPVANLLSGVYCVDNLADALVLRAKLHADQSVVTKDGIWLGKHWMRVAKNAALDTSIIAREKELAGLEALVPVQRDLVAQLDLDSNRGHTAIETLEQQLEQQQQQLAKAQQVSAQADAQLQAEQKNRERSQNRAEQLSNDISECQQLLTAFGADAAESETNLQQAQQQMQKDSHKREQLSAARGTYREALEQAREKNPS